MGVPTRAPAILIGNLVPFLVATIFVIGRIYARIGLLRQLGTDDYLLLVGWASACTMCVLSCLGTKYGAGMHQNDIPKSAIAPALKLNYATRVCYSGSFCFIKLAICVFYYRVFGTMNSAKWQIYALAAFVIAFTIPLEVENIVSCNPPRKDWEPSVDGYCLNPIVGFWTSFACNLISDIWIILFAIPKVWALKMQKRQKNMLLGVLTLSWVVVIAGIVRIARLFPILHNPDVTWVSYDSSIWSSVEINVSIICFSAPAWKPIFKRFLPGFMYSLTDKTSGNGKPSYGDRSTRSRSVHRKGVFKLSRSSNKKALVSQSREELAKTTRSNQWELAAADMNVNDDVHGEENPRMDGGETGIMKSTGLVYQHLYQPGPSVAA